MTCYTVINERTIMTTKTTATTDEMNCTEDTLLLVKDTTAPNMGTVRLGDWTPAKMYDALTEKVERELTERDASLSDDEFRDGMTLGTAVVDLTTNSIERINLTV